MHPDRQLDKAILSDSDFWSVLASGVVAVLATVTLVGWLWHIPEFIHPWMGQATMKANTALALLLSAVSMFCLHAFRRSGNKIWDLFGKCSAAFVAVTGCATIMEHCSGQSLGIDEVLSIDWGSQSGTSTPGRMGRLPEAGRCAPERGRTRQPSS